MFAAVAGVPESRAVVASQYAAARAAWPNIEVSFEYFLTRALATDAVEHLELRPSDFYLACAASQGDCAAIAVIERDCLTSTAPRLRRWGASPDDVQESLQAARERLFVGMESKIRSYNAAAPLKQWIHLVAVRIGIDLQRARRTQRELVNSLGAVDDAIDRGADPSTSLLKKTYRAEFERVLQAQIAKLEPQDRTILRLHLLEGVSVEKIATMRGVHRVTVARWLWRAGERMLEGVRRHFFVHHGLMPSECDSLVNLIRSQLTLDWSKLFGSVPSASLPRKPAHGH